MAKRGETMDWQVKYWNDLNHHADGKYSYSTPWSAKRHFEEAVRARQIRTPAGDRSHVRLIRKSDGAELAAWDGPGDQRLDVDSELTVILGDPYRVGGEGPFDDLLAPEEEEDAGYADDDVDEAPIPVTSVIIHTQEDPAMAGLHAPFASEFMGWMCADLQTECPQCALIITEPAGDLAKFIGLLDKHAGECGAIPSWACADCGWNWPLPGNPPPGSECDSCGGELEQQEISR